MSDDDLDLGEAADYILSERPGLAEDAVWAVLIELGDPPAPGQESLALQLLAAARPDVRAKDARRILREWQAYARLAGEDDWDWEEDDVSSAKGHGRGPFLRAVRSRDLVFRSDVDRLFAELFPGGRHAASNEARAPVDVYVADGEPPTLVVEMDAAGVDFRTWSTSRWRAACSSCAGSGAGAPGRRVYHHAEIAWGPFERRLRLGVQVDANATTASYEDGIRGSPCRWRPSSRCGASTSPPARRRREHGRARARAPDEREVPEAPEAPGEEVPSLEGPERRGGRRARGDHRAGRDAPGLPLKETVVFPEASPRWRSASRARSASSTT